MHKINQDKGQMLKDTIKTLAAGGLGAEHGSQGRSLAGPLSLLWVDTAPIPALCQMLKAAFAFYLFFHGSENLSRFLLVKGYRY